MKNPIIFQDTKNVTGKSTCTSILYYVLHVLVLFSSCLPDHDLVSSAAVGNLCKEQTIVTEYPIIKNADELKFCYFSEDNFSASSLGT